MAITHKSGHLKVQSSWLWNVPLAELPWKHTMVRSSSVANTWNHVKAWCVTTEIKASALGHLKEVNLNATPSASLLSLDTVLC